MTGRDGKGGREYGYCKSFVNSDGTSHRTGPMTMSKPPRQGPHSHGSRPSKGARDAPPGKRPRQSAHSPGSRPRTGAQDGPPGKWPRQSADSHGSRPADRHSERAIGHTTPRAHGPSADRPRTNDQRAQPKDASRRHRPSAAKGLWLYGRHAVEAALKNPARSHRKLWATREGIASLDGELPAQFPARVRRGRRSRTARRARRAAPGPRARMPAA